MVDCCPLVSWLGYELAGGDSALKTQKGGKISPAARRFIQSAKPFSAPPNQLEVRLSMLPSRRVPAERR